MSTLKLKQDALENRPQRLQRADTPRTLHIKKQIKKSPYLPALDTLPRFLRYGPWSPTAYLFLILFIFTMIYQAKYAYKLCPDFTNNSNSTNTTDNVFWNGIWRLFLSIYGMCLVGYMCYAFAWWPLTSFTMMSWNLWSVRYLFTAFISFGFNNYIFNLISEILRFPSLVCNSITVSVWWLVLFPSITFLIPSENARKAFLKFNASPFLLNVHLLNLPLAALDHFSNPRILNFFDLYMGVFIAMCYVLMYLFIMDPMGLHFYHVILSPRPHWCIVSYAICLSLFPLYLWGWNSIVLWLNLV